MYLMGEDMFLIKIGDEDGREKHDFNFCLFFVIWENLGLKNKNIKQQKD